MEIVLSSFPAAERRGWLCAFSSRHIHDLYIWSSSFEIYLSAGEKKIMYFHGNHRLFFGEFATVRASNRAMQLFFETNEQEDVPHLEQTKVLGK